MEIKELKQEIQQVNETKMESKVKEMPKICINDIEWEYLIKKYAFSASSGESILDDVNENTIEYIFNVMQEWDKANEESFKHFGMEYDKRVVDNTFQIYVDVVYFKENIDKNLLSINYLLTFLKEDDGIKLIGLSGEGDMRLTDVVSQDWKRDVYPYQNHTNKLLNEVYEKNKILCEKYENDEISWVELIHSLN